MVRDFERDVVVVGAGIAGLTTAYRLRELDVEVIDADSHVGGRTLSKQFSDHGWANYAAQYLSNDKVNVLALAEEMNMPLAGIDFPEAEVRGIEGLAKSQLDDIARAIERFELERTRPRAPTSPELDDLTLAEYLTDEPAHVRRYFEHWCSSLMCASAAETSVYGALLLWGDQRTTAFNDEPVVRSNRGDCLVEGGTNRLTLALAERSGASIALQTRVSAVTGDARGYEVIAVGPDGERRITARTVVCATPAPTTARICVGLPTWKHVALTSVRYGRFLATPIRVGAKGESVEPFTMTYCRAGQAYNSNSFALRTLGDFEVLGGCFHSYVYDTYARQIWDDPPHTVKTGAVRALLERHPHYEGRVTWVGYRRWRHGLPVYTPGRMKNQSALEASVGKLHFCGDYVFRSNTDGAVKSANRVAALILASLR